MNKTKKYAVQFITFMFVSFLIYLSMVYSGILLIDKKTSIYIVATCAGIFLIGTLIIAPGLNKNAEDFTLRFLLLTTVQMLIVFFIVGIVAFKQIDHVRIIGFHLLAIVVVLLFLQSYLLVKINNKIS